MSFFSNRRDFLQLLGGFGTILFFFRQKLFAQDSASSSSSDGNDPAQDVCDLKSVDDALLWSDERIAFWVMGCHIPDSQLSSKATLSVLLKYPQTQDSYVDKVVLSDNEKNLISARYFLSDDKIEGGGYPPYLIFDGLDLKNLSVPLSLTIQVRVSSGKLQRHRYTFTSNQLKPSSLNKDYLPLTLREDLKKSFDGGKISGFYQFQGNTLPFERFYLHTVRPYLTDIKSNNGFRLQVRFLHPDEALDHYNRYFVATDPVGRILGLKKRAFNDGLIDSCELTHLSEEERNQWLITQDNVARIWDCPYIMVFVDDVKEALVQANLWLR